MSEARAILSAVLLAAGVAAAVAAGVARMAVGDAPNIAGVRLAELAAGHADRTAQAGASPDETRDATRAWAAALQDALSEIAARGTVLLPARAIAAGAPDATEAVRRALARRLARPASDAEARQ